MIDKAEMAAKVAAEMSKEFVDQGKLIEAGWVSMRALAIPKDAPEIQVREMRMAFMAGAQHLFSSIFAIMDSDREPTAQDLKRMDLIHAELLVFGERELKARLDRGPNG